jgi:hypothetical protein
MKLLSRRPAEGRVTSLFWRRVTLTVGDKEYQASLPEAEWRILEPGGSYQVTISLLGMVRKMTPKSG